MAQFEKVQKESKRQLAEKAVAEKAAAAAVVEREAPEARAAKRRQLRRALQLRNFTGTATVFAFYCQVSVFVVFLVCCPCARTHARTQPRARGPRSNA